MTQTTPTDGPFAALAVRLKAFAALPHTRVYADKRFVFLGAAGLASCLILAFKPAVVAGAITDGVDEIAELAELNTDMDPILDLSRDDLFLEDGWDARLVSLDVTLKPGDNLGPLLQRNGVSPGTAHAMTKAFGEVFSPTKLRAGQVFTISKNGDSVTGLAFKPNVETSVFVETTDDGFAAREVAAEFDYEVVSLRTTIENSIYLDAQRLGAPDRVIQQFAHIYEYSVDFQRDIQPGDEMEMFFEVARDRRGDIIKSKDLLYTSFSPRGKASDYYLYADEEGVENYYDADGKTAKRKLRATPVNGARLSSGYGARRHPVLGYKKMHKGVDFAAPRGTPILAAGSGVVERANRFGSFGNYIKIRHTDGYKTAYAHLKGFNVKKGQRVRQDDVIGYVGTTGRSTGPHLHYEVHHNGKAINPRKLSQLSGKPLAKSEMAAFTARRGEIDALRATAPVIAPVSVLANDGTDRVPAVISLAEALD